MASDDKFLMTSLQSVPEASISTAPQFFRAMDPKDRSRLQSLAASVPNLIVIDTITVQISELIKTRYPKHQFTAGELAGHVEQHFGDCSAKEYGVWVYYPWSNRLVHLLDENEFIELRTNRNRYKITPDEQHLLALKRIGVIGLSVGQATALTMAMERSFGEIRLADYDVLELSNLNRLRSGVHNIALPKVVIAAREIAEIDPFLTVKCYWEGITEQNIDAFLTDNGRLDLLIEECDSMDIKFLARHHARAFNIPVVMDTSDRGLVDVERFDLEPSRPLFHGLVDAIDHNQLKGLSNEQKIPIVLKIVNPDAMSRRLKASLIEIEESISTWPQLASSVNLGGALTADIVRRILLDHSHASGRYFVDLEELVGDQGNPSTIQAATVNVRILTRTAMFDAVEMALRSSSLPTADHDLGEDEIQDLVSAGILAPSGGNCQPWKWLYRERRLFLFHDEQRSTSFLDYDNCASYVALGAASENVILRAHARGLSVQFQEFPLPQEMRLVAAFGFSRTPLPQSESHVCDFLANAISTRATNRRLTQRQPIAPAALSAMRTVVESMPGAKLVVISDDASLAKTASLLGAVERLRLLYPLTHHDMMSEIRWSSEEAQRTRDGIDLETMDLSAVDRAAINICRDWSAVELISKWGLGQALAKLVRKSVDAASCIALLTMPTDQPESYVRGGRALQRAWLMASMQNIAFQPLSPILYLFARLLRGNGSGMNPRMAAEVLALRKDFIELFGAEHGSGEILLFRLAIAEEPTTRALRRSVSDVLELYQPWGDNPAPKLNPS